MCRPEKTVSMHSYYCFGCHLLKSIMPVQVLRDVHGDADAAIEYLIAELASGDAGSSGSDESDPGSSVATGLCSSMYSLVMHA